MSPIVTVFGATGIQGSSVIDALLADGTFTHRAITRDPTSEKALKLKARGVEVVQVDLNDEDTTALDRALGGSEVVYSNTTSRDPAIRVGVKFLVWSSLPDVVDTISNGKFKNVHHFQTKAEVDKYLKNSGLPHAIVYTSWFADNVVNYNYRFRKTSTNSFELIIPRYNPTSTQAITWPGGAMGSSVLALFKNYDGQRREEVVGESFVVANARMTYPEFAELLSKALGKPVVTIYPQDTGMLEANEMYGFMSTTGMFSDTAIPDPKLVKLGVRFESLEVFANKFVKAKFT